MSVVTIPGKSEDVVPGDYSEFFESYYSYCRATVFGAGIDPQDVEDVTMSILEKFFAHQALYDYDPHRVVAHRGSEHTATFRSFLTGFVLTYVRHHRKRQAVRKGRELTVLDEPVGGSGLTASGSGGSGPALRRDVMMEASPDAFDHVYLITLVNKIRAHLATIKTRSYTCPLPDLFEALLYDAVHEGSQEIKRLAEYMEVNPATIRVRLNQLRVEIETVLCQ